MSAQHYPGGVAGAEVWYMVNHFDLDNGILINHAQNYIRIERCKGFDYKNYLYNFNHSIWTDGLCLGYIAPLENSVARNVFFVGEHKHGAFSNLTTQWRDGLDVNEPAQNRFDISIEGMQVNKQELLNYQQLDQTVSFYNWNIYQTQRKYKSYGYQGETLFSIGKEFGEPNGLNAAYYIGNFPEYISYPFELSKNQRIRIESYLALKYGITLNRRESYRNSKNTIFWNSQNNNEFGHRIFGIGRDDVSMLNQLISNSVHLKKFLIASVGEIAGTNFEKQLETEILEDHFIVFGDNSGDVKLKEEANDFRVRPLYRVWLSQNTGIKSSSIGMIFKLDEKLFELSHLAEVLLANPDLKLWMLHDRYVTNDEVSDFNSHYVDYYDILNLDLQEKKAITEKVFFDEDSNIYDQFTFGVGPELIVQARFDPVDCSFDEKFLKPNVVITGGTAPYDVEITSQTQNHNLYYNTWDNISQFDAYHPDSYYILVKDVNGVISETTIDIEIPHIEVDLGNDVVLSASQPSVTLDAGQDVSDPEATYQWFFNGVLMSHTDPILVADLQGEYTVVITAGNNICQVSDSVTLERRFSGTFESEPLCDPDYGQITINLDGGMGTYIFNIEPTIDIPPPQNSDQVILQNVPFGDYTITVTDVLGEGDIAVGNVSVLDPFEGIEVDLLSQFIQNCQVNFNYNGATYQFSGIIPFLVNCPTEYVIDASLLVTNPNVVYKWLINGQDSGIAVPTVLLKKDTWSLYPGYINEFEVFIVNQDNGCYLSEKFYSKEFNSLTPYLDVMPPLWKQVNEDSQSDDVEDEEIVIKEIKSIIYPNPSESGGRFFYELYSADGSEILDGIVGLYTVTGALLEQRNISGQSSYIIPYELHTTGVYFVRAQVNGKLLTDKVIIR